MLDYAKCVYGLITIVLSNVLLEAILSPHGNHMLSPWQALSYTLSPILKTLQRYTRTRPAFLLIYLFRQ